MVSGLGRGTQDCRRDAKGGQQQPSTPGALRMTLRAPGEEREGRRTGKSGPDRVPWSQVSQLPSGTKWPRCWQAWARL